MVASANRADLASWFGVQVLCFDIGQVHGSSTRISVFSSLTCFSRYYTIMCMI